MTAQGFDIPIEHLLRELTPQVLGTVVRRFRDFAEAEDAVQEASLAAAMQWPHEGIPENPRAWLTQVAFRRMADHIRSESARRRREGEAALDAAPTTESTAIETATPEDDTLVLLFMCCHSALTPASAIALTLRAVGGLTTAEIAHAFLVHDTGYRLVEVAAFPRSRPAISRTWNFAHNRGSAIESCLAACGIDA